MCSCLRWSVFVFLIGLRGESRIGTFELSAVEVISKPFSLRELATRVEEYLA